MIAQAFTPYFRAVVSQFEILTAFLTFGVVPPGGRQRP
jgi:hypothetical protein